MLERRKSEAELSKFFFFFFEQRRFKYEKKESKETEKLNILQK